MPALLSNEDIESQSKSLIKSFVALLLMAAAVEAFVCYRLYRTRKQYKSQELSMRNYNNRKFIFGGCFLLLIPRICFCAYAIHEIKTSDVDISGFDDDISVFLVVQQHLSMFLFIMLITYFSYIWMEYIIIIKNLGQEVARRKKIAKMVFYGTNVLVVIISIGCLISKYMEDNTPMKLLRSITLCLMLVINVVAIMTMVISGFKLKSLVSTIIAQSGMVMRSAKWFNVTLAALSVCCIVRCAVFGFRIYIKITNQPCIYDSLYRLSKESSISWIAVLIISYYVICEYLLVIALIFCLDINAPKKKRVNQASVASAETITRSHTHGGELTKSLLGGEPELPIIVAMAETPTLLTSGQDELRDRSYSTPVFV